MKKTLFRQLLTYMLLFLTLIGLLSYLVLEFYFNDYYYSRQEKVLIEKTEYLSELYENTTFSAFLETMEDYMLEQGMSILFLDTVNKNIYGSSTKAFGRMGLGNIFQREPDGEVFISSSTGPADSRSEWLSYLTKTNDGNLILGRISNTSIDSVVSSVVNFALIFGLVLALLFIIFSYFFSRSMSQPLKKLNDIAEKMGELDFSMKYEVNRMDEIGQLGKTLNSLTSKLENTIEQLKGELKKEKSLEKMRTLFTAQVSHELQTPLAVIRGYAEALSDGVYNTEESSDVYSVLLSESEKISNMVDDLLDLSQIESGVYVLRKEDFSLPSLVEKIIQRHKVLFGEDDFIISYASEYPQGVLFFGDALRIEQAIRNILNNAVKHVTVGGEIKISLYKEKNKSVIEISNDGNPIPEKDLSHIFDNFYQGENKKTGVGLGLSIAKHIVNLHDGTILAENKNNSVTIKITLP